MTISMWSRLTLAAGLALGLAACGDKGGEGANPGECTDRADNDENGLFDCDDPGCAGSPDCQDGDSGSNDGDDGTGDGTDGTKDDGGGTGGDPGGEGGEGGDPGGEGGEGGDPGGEGGEGGDPGGEGGEGGDPGGEGGEGGDPGGDPGGGTGGSGGSGGSGGGTGASYDGVYIGDVTIDATDGTDSDSCSGTWSGSASAGCSVSSDGACVEVVSSSIVDAKAVCTMTGSFSGIGPLTVTFSGSVNSSGNVTGTVDGYSTPFTGTVSTNTMFGNMTFAKNGITFNGSVQVDR